MKTYDKYKSSGIDWIGDIPEHWNVKKLKFSDDVIMGQSPNSSDYNYDELGFPFIQGNAEFTDLFPEPKIWCEHASKYALPNDILLSVRAPVGAVNLSNQQIGIGRGLCALRVNEHNNKFLYYFVIICHDELNSIGTGSTYLAVTTEDVKNTFALLPPLSEQTAIAEYLDEKTAQTDKLIDEKRRLIELLKEERLGVINKAVTRGINPRTKLKSSGISWLGDIPEHWEAVKFNLYISLRHGYQFMNYDFTPTGIRVIKISQLLPSGEMDVVNTSFIAPERLDEFQDILINKGDVLMALTGGTIGKIIQVKEVNEPLLQNYRVGNFFPANDKIIKRFIFWFLTSEALLSQIFYELRETGQPNIGKENFNSMYVTLPPIEEQKQIVEFIETAAAKIDATIAKIEKEIGYLREYRTALISEVVTGKIKVI